MSLKFPGVLTLLLLAACSQMPAKSDKKAELAAKPGAGQSKLPSQDLTSPMLFEVLLAETALQRGDTDIAVRTYL